MEIRKYMLLYHIFTDLHPNGGVAFYRLDGNVSGSIVPLYQADRPLYDYNLYLSWNIYVESGKVLLLDLLYMDIDKKNSDRCLSDHLELSQGKDATYGTTWHSERFSFGLKAISANSIIVLCGIATKMIFTNSDELTKIGFMSDIKDNRAGFNITYAQFEGGDMTCGTTLTASSDVIFSPDQTGDGRYDSLLTCKWTVYLDDESVIVLHFKAMDIHQSSKCTEDYLEMQEDHRNIGVVCGSNLPEPLTTEANILHLVFVSDLLKTGKGFKVVYYETKDVKTCTRNYHCLLSPRVIESSSLCDTLRDCPNNDDERFCDFRCPIGCDCFGLTMDCSTKHACRSNGEATNTSRSIYAPSSTRQLDISYNPTAFTLMNLKQSKLVHLTHLNLSHCGISKLKRDVFEYMVKLKVLDISFNHLRRLYSGLFSSQSALKILYLIGNFKPIIFEERTFTGLGQVRLELAHLHIDTISSYAFASLNLTQLSIYHSEIDTFDTNALGELSSEGIYLNTSIVHYFSKSMFDGVRGLRKLKTDAFKFCCVRPQFLPEEDCFPRKSEFSSCDDLIRNEVLRPLAWIIGLISIISNASSIIFRVTQQKEQIKRTYGFLVTNLAISDCMMGFYLLIVAVADTYYRTEYIFFDDSWRTSGWCNLAGILSAISNEASMLFVGLITLDRILLIKYPLGEVRLKIKHSVILALVAWLISFILAVYPVTNYPLFKDEFYSLSGVCLALPITRARPPGHLYSVMIFMGFNSIVYTLVALGQWSIFKGIKDSSTSLGENRSITSRDARAARRLLMVAVTDLMCWLPIFVLGVLALTDQEIEGEVFSWIAVVVLPINAAANPVIYTLLTVWQKTRTTQKSQILTATKSKHDEIDTNETITHDYTENWLTIWRRSEYWQDPSQTECFVALPNMLEANQYTTKQRILVAKAIILLLENLHAHSIIPRDLEMDDIFVTESQECIKVAMVLRPKHTLVPEDFKSSVASLGLVVRHLSAVTSGEM